MLDVPNTCTIVLALWRWICAKVCAQHPWMVIKANEIVGCDTLTGPGLSVSKQALDKPGWRLSDDHPSITLLISCNTRRPATLISLKKQLFLSLCRWLEQARCWHLCEVDIHVVMDWHNIHSASWIGYCYLLLLDMHHWSLMMSCTGDRYKCAFCTGEHRWSDAVEWICTILHRNLAWKDS